MLGIGYDRESNDFVWTIPTRINRELLYSLQNPTSPFSCEISKQKIVKMTLSRVSLAGSGTVCPIGSGLKSRYYQVWGPHIYYGKSFVTQMLEAGYLIVRLTACQSKGVDGHPGSDNRPAGVCPAIRVVTAI
jgi:hypothetical protein